MPTNTGKGYPSTTLLYGTLDKLAAGEITKTVALRALRSQLRKAKRMTRESEDHAEKWERLRMEQQAQQCRWLRAIVEVENSK